ncbi:outer membrane protein assembly factor BamD [Lysobacter firmicutimachus]|uniref:Outer membrane protein assembly factor BamD n=1 Tax=Lysobacter firmicutimachus TaxID=1792846 RepID=A0AAU8MNV6_9GAMM|nr:outer membrane protein assembly factor BamD [Lysobacter antibioticus]
MTVRSAPSRGFIRLLSLLLVVAVAGTGCSRVGKMFKKDKDADEGQPVEAIYQKAHTSMTNGNWASAEVSFKRLVAQYPYGPYTEQALIETAYAQYKSGKHDDAISSIDRFIRTYPTHRNIAYLYYLRGLVNSSRDTVFLQRVWRLDVSRRDLATPTQAYNDFLIVVERYPNSRYAEDARKRMLVLRDTFARHELDAALYYLRRTADVAAADRAKYLLETYPQSRYQYDAVAVLLTAYNRLGNETLAADARRVLQQNDPSHPALNGEWPDYPSNLRKLNPFAGEKSAVDNRDELEAERQKQ